MMAGCLHFLSHGISWGARSALVLANQRHPRRLPSASTSTPAGFHCLAVMRLGVPLTSLFFRMETPYSAGNFVIPVHSATATRLLSASWTRREILTAFNAKVQ